ncbi:MAG: Rrf2 family transcriptional regulator [Nitrososphaeria archaeon]
MKVSKRVAFGLRALLAIAKEPDKFHPVSSLAEKEGLPEMPTRQCLMRLRKAGFLIAEKGRTGGYKLANAPQEISIANVIHVLEDEIYLSLSQEKRRASLYEPDKKCPITPFWNRMEKKFWELLENVTLADLLKSKAPKS